LRSFIKAGIPAVSLAVVPVYGSMIAGCGEETPCDTSADCDLERYCSPEGVCVGSGYEGGDSDDMPIVFGRSSGDVSSRLMVTSVDGNAEREISTDQEAHITPSWSPDGRMIAFTNHFDGLYIIPSNGGTATRIVEVSDEIQQGLRSPTWCGDKILFEARDVSDRTFTIWKVNSDGSDLQTMFTPARFQQSFRDPSCSSRANFAYIFRDASVSANGDVYVASIDGGDPRIVPNTTGARGVYLSQDGSKMVVQINGSSLYVIDPDGSNRRQVTDIELDSLSGFSLSPNNQQLVLAGRTYAEIDGPRGIYRVDLATGETFRLTNSSAYENSPDWR